MKGRYSVPAYRRWIRTVLLWLGRTLFRILALVEVKGLENIPTGIPYIIVFNHVSIYDPPFLLSFWPVQPEILGAVELWSRPGQDILARLYKGIPIRRGEVDRDALDRALSVLASGLPLVFSPEGGRSHKPGLRRGKPGVVYLIDQSNVPVVPVGIVGTTDDFLSRAIRLQRPVLRMRVGEPFRLPPLEESSSQPKEIRQQRVDFIMEKLAGLLPAAYQGVYEHLDSEPVSPAPVA